MKTIPPPCPEPEGGQRYWRSLDDLADSPDFQQWVEREFPSGASEFTDPIGRRHFIKIMSASFMLAGFGLTGCRRPEEKILPFAKQPEGYIHGVAQFFATAMPTRGTALPLLVKSHEGRPTKIEGNPDHPDSNGATDTFAQASILGLYDPDRAKRFTREGHAVAREEALVFLSNLGGQAGQGQGLCFLLEQSSSPSRLRLQQEVAKKFPQARWFSYEPVDLQFGASTAVGGAVPYYKLDQAKVILALDCDFIGEEEDTYRHCRNFAKGRRIQKPADASALNRLYAVEGLMTLTGMNADHRLRAPTSSVIAVAAAIAAAIPGNAAAAAIAQKFPLPKSVDPKWIAECAADLAANKGASLVLAGYRQPPAVHAIAATINAALGNTGKTVTYREAGPQLGRLGDLAQSLNAGQVSTLVILGGNPAYTAPADLHWATLQPKAKTVIRLGYYEDETFPLCTWHFPLAHYLESWGDARTSDGTLVPIQPLIAPLFDGITELEVLARIGGLESNKPHDIVRDTFKQFAGQGNFEEAWKKFLHDGFLAKTEYKPVQANVANDLLSAATALPAPGKDNLEVVFHRDYKLDDGRWSNNGWLQELPDPITKTVWDGMILISRKTAEELGVKNGDDSADIVEVELGGRKIRGPVWIQPGLADYSLGLSIGYGRSKSDKGGVGRVGHKVGEYNAYALRTSTAEHFAVGAKLSRTGETHKVACTQEHGSMEGRPIVREATAEQFQKFPKFAQNMDLEAPSHSAHIEPDRETGRPKMIYEHPYQGYERRGGQVGVDLTGQLFKSDVHQWGMSIDLNTCVGCTACVLACQAENNVPIVGKDQVTRNREMHWLRIDRYWSGSSDKARKDQKSLVDDPQAIVQPMLCQHCENAPCESVCPVNATVHDEEGLNVMAYNRCVGTRYCSNNCPYKVRRFNFFDYNKHPLPDLYKSPLTSGHRGRWNLLNWLKEPSLHHTIEEDTWDIMQLVRNPDVSVRMRGVMEKCTFCVQRIEGAKIAQKVKAGASGAVQVPEGTIKTACQQACPTGAIVFGNLLDPNSEVSQLKKLPHDYSVLGFLDTRPRLTYLARIRNPNPKMPDYYETPLNIKEYMKENETNPFEEHHPAGHGSGASEGGKH